MMSVEAAPRAAALPAPSRAGAARGASRQSRSRELRRRITGWPVTLCLAAAALAPHRAANADAADAVDPALPHYVAEAVALPAGAPYVAASGAIRIVGYNDMRELLDALTRRFATTHPGWRFELDLTGTRSAPPALAANTTAFAPMGAEFTPRQLADYRAATGSAPLGLRIAHASLDPRALSGPLGIVVPKENPLRSIALPQLAAIYAGRATRWRDLGLDGEWAGRPIHACGLDPDTPLALFFAARVPGSTPYAASIAHFHQSRDVVARVAGDPFAIGFAAANRTLPALRLLALASAHGRSIEPTPQTIRSGRYPLDRYLLIYVRTPITPLAREFLRLALSREGQQAVVQTPQHYLPLDDAQAQRELAKLRRQAAVPAS